MCRSSGRPCWQPPLSKTIIADKSFFQFHDEVQAWTYYERERTDATAWENHLRRARELGSRSRQPLKVDKVKIWEWEHDTQLGRWTCANRTMKTQEDVRVVWEDVDEVGRFFHPILNEWHLYRDMFLYVEKPVGEKRLTEADYDDDMNEFFENDEVAMVRRSSAYQTQNS